MTFLDYCLMTTVSLRAAEANDAKAIADIYNYEVENTSATFDLVPRTIEAQREWIAARTGAFAAIVAEDSAVGVIGFAALSTYRDRAGYRTTGMTTPRLSISNTVPMRISTRQPARRTQSLRSRIRDNSHNVDRSAYFVIVVAAIGIEPMTFRL